MSSHYRAGVLDVERRARDRVAAGYAVTCRVPATPHKMRLMDVSRSGCRIALGSRDAPLGGTISVDLAPGISAQGQIVWSARNEAGVRFARQLSPAAAVALEIEEALTPEPEPAQPIDTPADGLLSHWFRMVYTSLRADRARRPAGLASLLGLR